MVSLPGFCSLTPFQQNEKWGYQNNQGKVVIDPIFDYAPEFKFQTELLVETSEAGDSQYYLYDRSGNRLFCFNELFEEDIAEINRYKESALFFVDVYDWTGRELSGMVNEQGQIIIPAKFISIESIGKDVFKVGYINTDELSETDIVKMKYGVYDSTGKEIFVPQFSEVGEFECSFGIADLNGKQVLINNSGIVVAGTEANSIERVSRMHYFLYHDNGVQLFIRPDEFGGTYDNIRSIQGNNIYFIAERKGLSVLIDIYDRTWYL